MISSHLTRTAPQKSGPIITPNPADITRILIVNPMPSTNDANARVETTISRYLRSNPNGRTVEIDILRLDVDVPNVEQHQKPTASYKVNEQAYATHMGLLNHGHYHGIHILGASCDHVPFEDTANRHLMTNIIDAAIDTKTGIFAICNGSFEVLNHLYGVQKHINTHPDHAKNPHGPQFLKIIGHFKNVVCNEEARHPEAEALKKALASAPVLPTGRVGFMVDIDIHNLADRGVLEILSTSPDMNARPDAQTSAVYDHEKRVLCLAPHVEYGNNAISSEATRDHQKPQGRTETPALEHIPNLHVHTDQEGRAPWDQAGRDLHAAWIQTINPLAKMIAIQDAANDGAYPSRDGIQPVTTGGRALTL